LAAAASPRNPPAAMLRAYAEDIVEVIRKYRQRVGAPNDSQNVIIFSFKTKSYSFISKNILAPLSMPRRY
jgi:hypothetical protein